MNAQDKNAAYEQAQAQANSIAAMVAALNVDYDRLEELRDELDSLEGDVKDALRPVHNPEAFEEAKKVLAQWRDEYAEEMKELEESSNDCKDEDEARERIQEDALEVQVRSDWHSPGEQQNTPTEFYILLCTGGPAVRIMGELNNYCEPCRAWIEYQDWGTPWTHAVGVIDQDTLLQYCRQFWFGE